MELLNEISSKVNDLVQLRISKGVSPSELMENIKEDDYVEIRATKVSDNIICNVKFYDSGLFDDIKTEFDYSYVYNMDMQLMEILLDQQNYKSLIWSRKDEENKLIDEICKLLYTTDRGDKKISHFIESLPMDLFNAIKNSKINIA